MFHGDLAEYDIFPKGTRLRETFKPAFHLYAQREIIYGLHVKLQYGQGSLAGGRITGAQSPQVNFETQYRTVALLASYDVFGQLFRKNDKPSKIYLFGEVGIGMSFYRSLSFWSGEYEYVRDYVGYEVVNENPATQRYVTTEKSKMANTLAVPVGVTFGYRINYKTDLTLNYTFTNLMTDRFDTWSRDWSAKDKYSYVGIGIRYNFNRSSDDYPKKKPRKQNNSPEKADGQSRNGLFRSKKDQASPQNVSIGEPLRSRQGSNLDQGNNGNLDDIKLKMFELQLKLFEMQYLINSTPAQK